MADQTDGMVQAIVERNRKEAKRAQEKSAAIGAAIAIGAFYIVTGLDVLHLPPSAGINVYRLIGVALCGALGGAIGNWIGRPPTRK